MTALANRGDETYRWVLIESGSNQDFIFRSPKRRYNVGASALLIKVSSWVQGAAKSLGAEVVVATSSKALLKVPDEASGKALIRAVTTKALTEAPGLDLWGVMEREARPNVSLGERLKDLHEAHRDARYGRPTPQRRALLLPFSQRCLVTGIAASALGSQGDGNGEVPLSAQAIAILDPADNRYKELKRLYDGIGDFAGQILDASSEDVSEDGWVAIVHADGNRVGQLIQAITDEQRLMEVSAALEAATASALKAAICEVGGPHPPAPWALPLIVGGDDVTVIVEGSKALRFADSYLRHFEEETASRGCLASLAAAQLGSAETTCITASAGVLACHAKTPFSLAYELVTKVTDQAKAVRELAPGRSAFSFFCAGDSIPDAVAADDPAWVDASQKQPRKVRTRGGLYVVAGKATSEEGCSDTQRQWAIAHSAKALLDAVDALVSDQSPVSSGRVSEIRMQFGAGHVRAATINRAKAASQASEGFIEEHLVVIDGKTQEDTVGFTRWLDINDAVSLERGKVEAAQTTTDDAAQREQSA